MALTRDFRETVQARARRDPAFRKGLLSDAVESLLSGEVTLGKELLRDYINAAVGFPELAAQTGIHVKTLHQMFGANGNPTAGNLFEIIASLQRARCSLRNPVCGAPLATRKAVIAAPGKTDDCQSCEQLNSAAADSPESRSEPVSG